MDANFIRTGYRVEPAENGGFIVWDRPEQHMMGRCLGSFTDHQDLLEWLTEKHVAYYQSSLPTTLPVKVSDNE